MWSSVAYNSIKNPSAGFNIIPLRRTTQQYKVNAWMQRNFNLSESISVWIPMLSWCIISINVNAWYTTQARNPGQPCETHMVELGFAFTDFKVQGLTCNELIIMLNKQKQCWYHGPSAYCERDFNRKHLCRVTFDIHHASNDISYARRTTRQKTTSRSKIIHSTPNA